MAQVTISRGKPLILLLSILISFPIRHVAVFLSIKSAFSSV
jgi:hypothetical protein